MFDRLSVSAKLDGVVSSVQLATKVGVASHVSTTSEVTVSAAPSHDKTVARKLAIVLPVVLALKEIEAFWPA